MTADVLPLRSLDPWLDDEMSRVLEEGEITGGAVTIVAGGKIYRKLHGRRMWPDGQPVDGETLFDIGSCSKAFTATLAALLVRDGLLDWDAPLREGVPEFALHDRWVSEHVSLRDVLGNRLGLSRQLPTEFGVDPEVPLAEVLARARHVPPRYGFRARFSYCNLGFMAAALAIERQAGASFNDVLEERLLRPLEMTRTSGRPRHAGRSDNRAQGYAVIDGSLAAVDEEHFGNYQGCGGIFASADELGLWLLANMGLDRGTAVPTDVYDALFEPQTYIHPDDRLLWLAPPESLFAGYGLGWSVCDFHDERLVQHGGEGAGTRAQIALLPDRGIGVAVCLATASTVHTPLAYLALERILLGRARDWLAVAREDQALRAESAARGLAGFEAPDEAASPIPLGAIAGMYESRATGRVEVSAAPLELRLENARLWRERLQLLGGNLFEGTYCELAARAYTTAPSRIAFVIAGEEVVAMDHAVLGYLERVVD